MFSLYRSLQKVVAKRVEMYGAQYVPFGIFGVINYPLSFVMWQSITPQNYTSFIIRMIITLLCIPLIFAKQWPERFKPHLPIYWYLVVLVSLPFFGVFMLLKNQLSAPWLMNEMLGLFLFILLVDWLSFIVLLILGASMGWLFYMLAVPDSSYISIQELLLATYMYILVVLIGVIFSRNKENMMLRKQVKAAQVISACIAHELRSPLATIRASVESVLKVFPALMKAYQTAEHHGLVLDKISHGRQTGLSTSLEYALSEVHASNVIINIILHNLGDVKLRKKDIERISISDCIAFAESRYPFISERERMLLHIDIKQDFTTLGNQELIVHVLFNLLKNALYHIAKAGQGQIYIETRATEKQSTLIFKDTGPGIPSAQLPYIFDRFFTTTKSAGIGLAFCKMVMQALDGKIVCYSQPGQFTEFILSFPKA